MPTVTILHRGVATGQEANWIPTIPGNIGLSVQNNDANYVASGNDAFGFPKNGLDLWNDVSANTPLWIDDGTLSAPGITINSLTVGIYHANTDAANDLDVWLGISQGGGPFGPTYGYDEGDLGGYSLLSHLSPGYTNNTHRFLLNPFTGVAWVPNDIFLAASSGGQISFYFDKFRDGAVYADYSKYHVNQIYLVADYSVARAPISVSVSGAGGILAAGSAPQGESLIGQGGVQVAGVPVSIFGAGTGPAAELHLNQWGIEAFTLDTTLEEHL
jgi:hypothetical protein